MTGGGGREGASSGRGSNRDSLDLIEGEFVVSPIIELGRLRRLVDGASKPGVTGLVGLEDEHAEGDGRSGRKTCVSNGERVRGGVLSVSAAVGVSQLGKLVSDGAEVA